MSKKSSNLKFQTFKPLKSSASGGSLNLSFTSGQNNSESCIESLSVPEIGIMGFLGKIGEIEAIKISDLSQSVISHPETSENQLKSCHQLKEHLEDHLTFFQSLKISFFDPESLLKFRRKFSGNLNLKFIQVFLPSLKILIIWVNITVFHVFDKISLSI